MSFGICNLSVVPCRAEPNDRAEIVTQLLFGEHYSVLEEQEKWVKIKIAHDGYEAWICRKQFLEITSLEYDELQINSFPVLASDFAEINNNKYGKQLIVKGSTLPYFHKNNLKIRNERFNISGKLASLSSDDIIRYALEYLNTPYLWGGRSPFGIDCSGFTQVVYKLCGIQLPRDAYQQAKMGEEVSFVSAAPEGSLAFFDNEEGRITHVGIVMNEGKIIHASGKVRIDLLDHQGIYNEQLKSYTHKLRLVKSFTI